MRLKLTELKEFLDEKADKYNCPDFIAHDPVSIPHQYTLKEDIEISEIGAGGIGHNSLPISLDSGAPDAHES